MKNIILTDENLHAASSSGYAGFTRAQLAELGISWPPTHGWLKRLIGKEISVESYQRFCAAGKIKAGQFRRIEKQKKINAKKIAPLLVRSCEFTDDNGNEMVHVQYDLTASDAKSCSHLSANFNP